MSVQVPPLSLKLNLPPSDPPQRSRNGKPSSAPYDIPSPPLSARAAPRKKPFRAKLIKNNSISNLFTQKKGGSQPSFEMPIKQEFDPLSHSMIELPNISSKDSSSSSLSGSAPESPKAMSISPRTGRTSVSPRIVTVSTVVTDTSPKLERQSEKKVDAKKNEKTKLSRFFKKICTFRGRRRELGVMHAGLKDEHGNLFPIDRLLHIHPAQFLRSCPNAADITITLPGALGEVKIDCSQLTLSAIISELNFVLSTPELGFLEESFASSSSSSGFEVQQIETGFFSTSDYHLLSPDEKSQALSEELQDKKSYQKFLDQKESNFKASYPILHEKLSSFMGELLTIDDPAFDEVVSQLQVFLNDNPGDDTGLRRLFFQLKDANPEKPSFKYYRFENLPLEVSIKKLFPDKKVELAHILQLVSINAFRVADLLFKQDYPGFYKAFAISKNDQSMRYHLHCHEKNHWTVTLVKWCDIISKDLIGVASSSNGQPAIATMAYSISFEVNPFGEQSAKIMAGKMRIESFETKVDESEASVIGLNQIFSRKRGR